MPKKTKSTKPKTTRKRKKKSAPKSEHGEIFFQWSFPEHVLHDRKRGWYIIVTILAILFVIYGIWTGNYLFIVIILLIALIYGLDHMQEPNEILFQINEDGVFLGQRFYRWRDLKNFWIAYDPPEVKWLYFTHKRKLFPVIAVPLEEFNPVQIRRVLLKYIPEDLDKEDELPSDTFTRIFKL